LNSLTNDDPGVQALRREAAALIDEGEFDPADAKLSEAERIDLVAVEEWRTLPRVAARAQPRAGLNAELPPACDSTTAELPRISPRRLPWWHETTRPRGAIA
jgi:hypothetical protein